MATATTAVSALHASSTAKVGTVRRPPAMLMRWLSRAEPVLYRNLLAQQQHPCADIWPDVVDPETTIQ